MHLLTLLSGFFLIYIKLLTASSREAPDDVVLLRATRGLEARLPCGQGKLFLDGPKAFVLWLKDDKEFKFRFPHKENMERRTGRHDRVLDTLCESGYCPDDTSLVIKMAKDQDAGLYRCRVHFQASPSLDYVIDLKVVEPTSLPRIFSGNGELLNKGFVGPLGLESDLKLICEIEDKDPQTELYWRRNGAVVDRAYTSALENMLRVDIRLYNLSRGEADAKFECLAQNSDVSEPLVASVVLKMYLPPMSVEIRMNNNTDFEAGQPRVVDCVVVGCMPPPIITWHLGSTMVRPSVHKELHDGNYTVSSLTLAPSLRHNRSELVCRAYNTVIPDELFQDKVTINVGYRPVCGMSWEPRIGAVVGEAEVAMCIVDSFPEPLQFTWTFTDSETVHTSFTKMAGFKNRYSSHLNWLSRGGDIGILSCSASNKFGEMKKSCTFNVTAGGPPHLPDCEVTRIYPNSLRVKCEKKWDGGRPQMIHLDIVNESGVRVKNLTDGTGSFFIGYINEKRNVSAVLYATNRRGKSEERTIYLQSLVPVFEPTNKHDKAPWKPYLDAVAGTVALLVLFATSILVVKFLGSRPQTPDLSPDIVPRIDGVFHREPDFTRDERLPGPRSTCITVNTLTGCQNQYSPSPLPTCRVLLGHEARCSPEPSSQHSYYV